MRGAARERTFRVLEWQRAAMVAKEKLEYPLARSTARLGGEVDRASEAWDAMKNPVDNNGGG